MSGYNTETIKQLEEMPEVLHPIFKEQLAKSWNISEEQVEKLDFSQSFADAGTIQLHDILVSREKDPYPVTVEVPSLRALFRGSYDPGPQVDEGKIPIYIRMVSYIERSWLMCVKTGLYPIPRDAEMHEYYSQLRRRPDGKQLINEPMYKLLWQILAYFAGKYEVSEAVYNHCLTRLIHSCSVFRTSIASANMYANIGPVYFSD